LKHQKDASEEINHDSLEMNHDSLEINYDTPEINCDTPEINYDSPEINHDPLEINYDSPEIIRDIEEINYDSLELEEIDRSPLPHKKRKSRKRKARGHKKQPATLNTTGNFCLSLTKLTTFFAIVIMIVFWMIELIDTVK
jgi:hypothetical protein